MSIGYQVIAIVSHFTYFVVRFEFRELECGAAILPIGLAVWYGRV